MKNQTAIEWLNKQLWKNEGVNIPIELLEVAIEMEKLQIIHAHLTGLIYSLNGSASEQALQYYNENYKNEEQ